MTLRLTDDEASALRRSAEAEHRSMQDMAREAIRDYVARRDTDREVHALGVEAVDRWRPLLDRLGE